MRRYMLMTAFAIAAVFVGLFAIERVDAQDAAPAEYTVSVSFTVPNPAGNPIVVELPDEVAKWNIPKVIEFEVGSETYHVTAFVKHNEKRDKVAKITARIDIDGEQLAFPSIELPIGTQAKTVANGYGLRVKVVEAK